MPTSRKTTVAGSSAERAGALARVGQPVRVAGHPGHSLSASQYLQAGYPLAATNTRVLIQPAWPLATTTVRLCRTLPTLRVRRDGSRLQAARAK